MNLTNNFWPLKSKENNSSTKVVFIIIHIPFYSFFSPSGGSLLVVQFIGNLSVAQCIIVFRYLNKT